MAAIKEILEIEQSRETAAEWWKIHLFQEGSFYRAYEVSAWLCHTYVSQFKVTHRHVKGVEFLGAYLKPLSAVYGSASSFICSSVRPRLRAMTSKGTPLSFNARAIARVVSCLFCLFCVLS